MKRRLLIAAFLFLLGFNVFTAFSGAPPRVHIAAALTWTPTVFAACAIFWAAKLRRRSKAILTSLVFGIGGFLTNLSSNLVGPKYEFMIKYYLATVAFLVLMAFGLIGATLICDRMLRSISLKTDKIGSTGPDLDEER